MRTLLVAFAVLLALPAAALAHEHGAIHLASSQVRVAGDVALTGEKLPKSTMLQLQLRGTLNTYPLQALRTDAKGTVQARLPLPSDVPAGAYTLVVLAPDGDVVARAELGITPAATASTPAERSAMPAMAQGASMPHMAQEMSGPHATAEMMALDRSTSPGEWAAIVALIALSAAGGVMLLRKASGTPTEAE
jgi:hypothetical protein